MTSCPRQLCNHTWLACHLHDSICLPLHIPLLSFLGLGMLQAVQGP